LQHFHAIGQLGASHGVVDFSLPALDLAYCRTTLSKPDVKIFETVLTRVLEKVGKPDLIVRLRCPPGVELERIRRRARSVESGIQIEYLSTLEAAIDDVLATDPFGNVPTIFLDSVANDFRSSGIQRDQVAERIAKAAARTNGSASTT